MFANSAPALLIIIAAAMHVQAQDSSAYPMVPPSSAQVQSSYPENQGVAPSVAAAPASAYPESMPMDTSAPAPAPVYFPHPPAPRPASFMIEGTPQPYQPQSAPSSSGVAPSNVNRLPQSTSKPIVIVVQQDQPATCSCAQTTTPQDLPASQPRRPRPHYPRPSAVPMPQATPSPSYPAVAPSNVSRQPSRVQAMPKKPCPKTLAQAAPQDLFAPATYGSYSPSPSDVAPSAVNRPRRHHHYRPRFQNGPTSFAVPKKPCPKKSQLAPAAITAFQDTPSYTDSQNTFADYARPTARSQFRASASNGSRSLSSSKSLSPSRSRSRSSGLSRSSSRRSRSASGAAQRDSFGRLPGGRRFAAPSLQPFPTPFANSLNFPGQRPRPPFWQPRPAPRFPSLRRRQFSNSWDSLSQGSTQFSSSAWGYNDNSFDNQADSTLNDSYSDDGYDSDAQDTSSWDSNDGSQDSTSSGQDNGSVSDQIVNNQVDSSSTASGIPGPEIDYMASSSN